MTPFFHCSYPNRVLCLCRSCQSFDGKNENFFNRVFYPTRVCVRRNHMVSQNAPSTPMLVFSGFAERACLGPLFLVVIWSTLILTLNATALGLKLGNPDFAGGTPVHISFGIAVLAISLYLMKHRYGTAALAHAPYEFLAQFSSGLGGSVCGFESSLGMSGSDCPTGFNGGSALGANLRAAQACIVTNLAASVGGLTWMAWV
jgi:Amt family ammonium transporter